MSDKCSLRMLLSEGRVKIIKPITVLFAFVLVLVACTNKQKTYEEEIGWIGVASMDSERTIFLQIRSEDDNGMVAHGFFEYPNDHEDYQKIYDHIGGIEIGEEKPFPPWKNEGD